MSLRSGVRDRRVRLERYTVTQNELNEDVKTWGLLAEVWAAKGYRRANEAQVAAEVSAIRVLRFEIGWSPAVEDLNAKDRIEYPIGSGVYFDLSEVNEIGRREGLEIFATARADGGTN